MTTVVQRDDKAANILLAGPGDPRGSAPQRAGWSECSMPAAGDQAVSPAAGQRRGGSARRRSLRLLLLVALAALGALAVGRMTITGYLSLRSETDAIRPAAAREAAQDGMVLVHVPAGEFLMGAAQTDPDGHSDERPQHTVYLDEYWIDRTEVTNGMFAHFVAASGYDADGSSAAWASGPADLPMELVTWHDADAYCRWAGRQLPTEAQWEKAARGTDGRKYPWGEEAPSDRLLNWDAVGPDGRLGPLWLGDGYERTAPVGSYPAGAGPYGALDMAGNVWEWVADWYLDGYYEASPRENPTGPDSGRSRVVRGGTWYGVAASVRASARSLDVPEGRFGNLGFRCAFP